MMSGFAATMGIHENAPATLERPGAGHGGISSMPRKTLEQRFWEKVDRRGPDDCWPWLGSIRGNGYGQFNAGRIVKAHRVAYELAVGPIPDGLMVDHICHSRDADCRGGNACAHRACVNPAHLELVTHQENVARGRAIPPRAPTPTHCPRGHAYDQENTYFRPSGARVCRRCGRDGKRRAYAERKAAHGQAARV